MKAHVYWKGEEVGVVDFETVKEYFDFLENEFPFLLAMGYKVECDGSIG